MYVRRLSSCCAVSSSSVRQKTAQTDSRAKPGRSSVLSRLVTEDGELSFCSASFAVENVNQRTPTNTRGTQPRYPNIEEAKPAATVRSLPTALQLRKTRIFSYKIRRLFFSSSHLLKADHSPVGGSALSQPTRVLFVDDEERLRVLWPAILSREGFEVEVASSVSEALKFITTHKFDVLVADLNLGQPGDGFTIVSAMRRVQPDAVTLIFTGYPAFQAALRAIHEQVDDFLIKGTDPDLLVQSIRHRLTHPQKNGQVLAKRVSQIIAENRHDIVEQWYASAERDSEVSQIPLTKEERVDHLPEVLDELVRPERFQGDAGRKARAAASKHGETRRRQQYTLGMLLEETRIFHRVICDCVQGNLLYVDLSNVVPDMIEIDDRTHLLLRDSLETFLQLGGVPHAA